MKFRKVELRMAIRNALRDTAHSQTVVSNTTQPSKMEELLKDLNYIKNTMTSVSTEGAMIQDVNDEYKQTVRLQLLMQKECWTHISLLNYKVLKIKD